MEIVNVVILEDGGNTDLVKSYFSSPGFNIIENTLNPGAPEQERTEKDLFFSALHTSYVAFPDRNCIVIKNTSFSTHTPENIYSIVFSGISIPDVDLFYLCKWQDMCSAYTSVQSESKSGIYWTRRPKGFQCVLFTPEGISKVLSIKPLRKGGYFRCVQVKDRYAILSGPRSVQDTSIAQELTAAIDSGNMKAICTTPNLFDFDAMEYATTNEEFSKLNECAISTERDASSGASPHIYFYALGAIILIIIIGIGLSKMGPDSRSVQTHRTREDGLLERGDVTEKYIKTSTREIHL